MFRLARIHSIIDKWTDRQHYQVSAIISPSRTDANSIISTAQTDPKSVRLKDGSTDYNPYL